VRHHIVAELLFIASGLPEIDIVKATGHLLYLALLYVQAKLPLRPGKFQPEPAPGAELLLSPEKLSHFLRSISLNERTRVNVFVFRHFVLDVRVYSVSSFA
jgi:hypothetical protein